MSQDLTKILIGITLFLSEHHGFTPELQAEYMAKAEIFSTGVQANSKEFLKIMADTKASFDKQVRDKKAEILEGIES